MTTRPVHPTQTLLHDRIDQVTNSLAYLLEALTGELTGYVLLVYPPDDQHAGMVVTNDKAETAIRALRHMADSLEAKHRGEPPPEQEAHP